MIASTERTARCCAFTTLSFATILLMAPFVAAEGSSHAQSGEAKKVVCPIDRGPVTTNVLLRVFPLRIGSLSGTGFTIEIDHRQYIVTAKHILSGDLPGAIEVQLDEWTTVPVKLVGMGRDKQDVLVLATNRQISEVFPVDEGTDGLMLGQSVRFLGYFPAEQTSVGYFPGVHTSPLPGYKNRGAPLVMSGIVSGFHLSADDDGGSSILVDGHNNKGFSGGPVVFQPAQARTRDECRWKIAGVISNYVPAPAEVRSATEGATAAVAISNAGLLRAIPIADCTRADRRQSDWLSDRSVTFGCSRITECCVYRRGSS